MTHLRIEQNNGTTEDVSSSVVNKLYEIASSGNLDNIRLIGKIKTPIAYSNKFNFLTQHFSDLNIIVDTLYLSFQSNITEQFLANLKDNNNQYICGDGTGVLIDKIQTVSQLPNWMSEIDYFDELSQFTNITTLSNLQFWVSGENLNNPSQKSMLKSIDLSNIKVLGNSRQAGSNYASVFRHCNQLQNLGNISNIEIIGTYTFLGCSSLPNKWYYFQSIKEVGSDPYSDTSVSKIIYGQNLTYLSSSIYNVANIIILATTPPTLPDNDFSSIFKNKGGKVYVPDSALSSYQTEWNNTSVLHAISELSSSTIQQVLTDTGLDLTQYTT